MAWLGFRCSGPTIYSQPHDTASNHAQLRTRAPRVSDLYLGCTSNFSFQRIQYMRGHGARSIISLAFLLTHCMITCQALLHYKSSKLIHTPPFPSHPRSSLTRHRSDSVGRSTRLRPRGPSKQPKYAYNDPRCTYNR